MIGCEGDSRMNMDFGLYQKQSTKLVMTNELRQAINILQLSTQELVSLIEEQQLDNPLLEVEDFSLQNSVTEDVSADWKTYEGENISPFEFISQNDTSLQHHLLNQLHFLHLSEDEKRAVTHLIFSLDENGYLTSSVEDEAVSTEEALQILQSLDPVGVGARSLKECLLLQLRTLEPRNLNAETIVEHHLTLLANKCWKSLAKILSITLEEVQSVSDLIQTLKPRPGALYTSEPTSYISPDVFIEFINDKLVTYTNDHVLPKVTISNQYQSLLKNCTDQPSLKYVQQKEHQVMWLLKSIDQRQITLLKVTEAICKKQANFFKYGYDFFNPITLKEIAAEIDVHESTVSRVTSHKYVQTPRGLFELKYFFSSGVKAETGGSTSSVSVKQIIKKAIGEENKQKPLSDQKLASILDREHSIEISRRTVAKYRDELNILPSSKRKRF